MELPSLFISPFKALVTGPYNKGIHIFRTFWATKLSFSRMETIYAFCKATFSS